MILSTVETDFVTMLLCLKQPDQVMTCLVNKSDYWPGLTLKIVHGLPLEAFIVDTLGPLLRSMGLELEGLVPLSLGLLNRESTIGAYEPSTLICGYLKMSPSHDPAKIFDGYNWVKVPDVLRSLAKDRARLPYLKALQVFAGGLSENTKALEASDVVQALKQP